MSANNCTCAACVHALVIGLWRALAPLPARLLLPSSCARHWQRGAVVVRWGSA